jgi:hypothetical protein
MKKPLLLIVGLVFGFLFAEIVRQKKMARLQTLEAQTAERKAQSAEYDREWQRELANMPFDERIDWELFEASLKLDGHIKDDNHEET